MTKFLLHFLCPDGAPADSPRVRARCGLVSGVTGIVLNLLLFLGKLFSGLVTGSVAVVGDAVNNLSDAASSVMTLVGFHLAGLDADERHPFGHGRMEYLTGLLVALAILLMGFEVGHSSVRKILHPEEIAFSWAAAAILLCAIGVKLWMYFFNRALSRIIHSEAMEATAADSLSDALSTAVVLLSTLICRYTHLHIDGWAGLLVAIFILKTGWDSVRDTMDPLLGRPMPEELAEEIDALVLRHPFILGIHDLVYHDYGPGRAMMTFHAEVPADADFLEVHDMIDHIERELKARHHIETVIHMDPVVRDEATLALREQVAALARELDPGLTIHDFRVAPRPEYSILSFDVLLPYGCPLSGAEVKHELECRVREMPGRYCAIIETDHSYIARSGEKK